MYRISWVGEISFLNVLCCINVYLTLSGVNVRSKFKNLKGPNSKSLQLEKKRRISSISGLEMLLTKEPLLMVHHPCRNSLLRREKLKMELVWISFFCQHCSNFKYSVHIITVAALSNSNIIIWHHISGPSLRVFAKQI